MKYKGTIIAEGSGSVGGLTFSHNRGGQYIRQRVIPINPNTVQQAAVKGFMASLSNRWVNVLTAPQRAAWDAYANAVQIPDPLGTPRNIGGLAMYNRSNVSRLQASLARVDPAPSVFDLGDFTAPTITSITASTGIMVLAFTNTDSWATAAGGALLVYASRPQNPTINGFKGPYRFASKVSGASTPPTSPSNITLPFPVAAGQRVFLQFRASQSDGRLSGVFQTFQLAV